MNRKRILITGGASGLGKALAMRFAHQGYGVLIVDVNNERGAEALSELQQIHEDVAYNHCDVSQEADFRRIAEFLQDTWQGVDVVVNNAGVGGTAGKIEDVSGGDWEWVWSINVLGVVHGCKVFTPIFKAQGHGYFVNVASMAGLLNAPFMSNYNVSKAAVISLSETLNIELRDDNIGVSVVCPAFFKTNLTENLRSHQSDIQGRVQRWMEASTVSAEDVAKAIETAIEQRRFWVLTHALERRLWRFKRWVPTIFENMMIKRFLPKMRRANEQRSTDPNHAQ